MSDSKGIAIGTGICCWAAAAGEAAAIFWESRMMIYVFVSDPDSIISPSDGVELGDLDLREDMVAVTLQEVTDGPCLFY